LISDKIQPKFDEFSDKGLHEDQLETLIPSRKDKLKIFLANLKEGMDPYFSDYHYHKTSKIYRNPIYNSRKITNEYDKITKSQLNQKLHSILKNSLDISLSPNIKKINSSEFYTNNDVI